MGLPLQYKPEVVWRAFAKRVVLTEKATEEFPAEYSLQVIAIDKHEPGSNTIEPGYFFMSFMGDPYTILSYDDLTSTIIVVDEFRIGKSPTSNKIGIVYKSMGGGLSPYLAPIYYRHLHRTALDNSKRIEQNILWHYINLINTKWHPEGLIFKATDDAIEWTSGKINIHNWDSRVSEKQINYVTNYDFVDTTPVHRIYTFESGTFDFESDVLHYIYAFVPIDETEIIADINIIPSYYREKIYKDRLCILMGVITSVNDGRHIILDWAKSSPDVQELINNSLPNLKTGWKQNAWDMVTVTAVGRTITLTPVGASYDYWIQGEQFIKTQAESIQVPDTTGLWFVYYNGETLEASLTPWNILADLYAFVSVFYWNATQQKIVLAGWELHTFGMDAANHNLQHYAFGTRYISGLGVSINATDVWKIDVTDGTILDEDIPAFIHNTAGYLTFRQTLVALEAPKIYRTGAGVWNVDDSILTNIVSLDGSNEVYVNLNTGGIWSLQATTFNKYSAMWLVAFTGWEYPCKWVIGQHPGDTLNSAKELNTLETLDLSGMPGPEKRLLARVIVKNLNEAPWYEIVEIEELQQDDAVPGGEVTNDSYVTGATWDAVTQTVTLTRNNGLPSIPIPIPSNLNIFTEPHPQFPINFLKYLLGDTTMYVTDIPKPDGLLIGGNVTWIEGLTFAIAPVAGYFSGDLATIEIDSSITLDVSDATHPRIDVIVFNVDETVTKITGIPSANPQKPTVDPTTQIELTSVLVLANALTPDGVTDELIYNENVEWVGTANGVSINLDSNVSPQNGLVCASIGAIGNGDYVTFTAPSPKNVADYETLLLYLKLKAITTKSHFLVAQFYLSGTSVSSELILKFNSTDITNWQNITTQLSLFNFSSETFDAIRFKWVKTGAQVDHTGFYLDYIKLQAGIVQPPVDQVDSYVTSAVYNSSTHILTITRNNGLPPINVSMVGIDGMPGTPGADGEDGRGIVSIELYTTVGLVKTYRIIFTDATTFDFDVTDGEDGSGSGGVIQDTGTLVVANWVADGDLFKYVLSNANITATSSVEVIPANASYDVLVAAEPRSETESATGTVTMWVKNTPSADIPVTINITEVV